VLRHGGAYRLRKPRRCSTNSPPLPKDYEALPWVGPQRRPSCVGIASRSGVGCRDGARRDGCPFWSGRMPTDIPPVARRRVRRPGNSSDARPTGLLLAIIGLAMATLSIGLDSRWDARWLSSSGSGWSRTRFRKSEMRIPQERPHDWPHHRQEMGGVGGSSNDTHATAPVWRGKARTSVQCAHSRSCADEAA
jgi:hypothetical protein